MTRELITNWHDYEIAAERLLTIAQEKILIYANELTAFKLESAANLSAISRILKTNQPGCLQVVLRNCQTWQQTHPLMAKLCLNHSHLITFLQSPADLAHLTDSMLLIDNTHALVRFEERFPRSKLLLDEAEEIRPYLLRFYEICAASNEPYGYSTLGL